MATFLRHRARFLGAFALALAVLSGFSGSASAVGLGPMVNRQAYYNSEMTGVSCWSSSGCVAFGWYAPGNTRLALVLRTTDGGTSWKRVKLSIGANSVSCPSPSHCVAVGAKVLLTTDGGSRWTVMSVPDAGPNVDCPSRSVCFSGWAPGVKSTDGGRTWKTQSNKIAFETYGSINQISCPTTSVCYAATTGYLLRTANGGASWTPLILPSTRNTMIWGVSCPTASSCGVVTGSGTFLRTTDGGKKWTRHSVGPQELTIVSCSSTFTCEVGGFTVSSASWAVYETTNGGNTWTPDGLPSPPATNPNGNIQFLAGIQCYGGGTCMMVGQYPGTTAAIFKTTDGVDWTSQPVPL
jgi:photosystem II stability/assembly factor-like uncharacterized protein